MMHQEFANRTDAAQFAVAIEAEGFEDVRVEFRTASDDFTVCYHSPRRYNVVRMYENSSRRVILANVSLTDARAHCSDPETSSRTATASTARKRTARTGVWFDGYELA